MFYIIGNIVETLSLFCERQRRKIEFFVLRPPSANVTVASDIMVSVTRLQISKIRYATINMYYCDSSRRESL